MLELLGQLGGEGTIGAGGHRWRESYVQMYYGSMQGAVVRLSTHDVFNGCIRFSDLSLVLPSAMCAQLTGGECGTLARSQT